MAEHYVICLTGNIATGKSTVARILEELGATFIDADQVAHQMMAPNGPAYATLVEAFGPEILHPTGTVNRRRLGAIVFSDPEALRRLETIVHPPTIAEVERQIAAASTPVVVVEAIKLLESGLARQVCHSIWVTHCDEATQLRRLMYQRYLAREDALNRIRSQPPQELKLAQADVIINTGGSLEATRRQVLEAWQQHVVPHL